MSLGICASKQHLQNWRRWMNQFYAHLCLRSLWGPCLPPFCSYKVMPLHESILEEEILCISNILEMKSQLLYHLTSKCFHTPGNCLLVPELGGRWFQADNTFVPYHLHGKEKCQNGMRGNPGYLEKTASFSWS